MKIVKNGLKYILMAIVMASFSQCSSVKELQAQAPVNLGEVYCQDWVAGVEGGGAGTNIFIPTTDTSIKFEKVYFRGKMANLEIKDGLYIGRFKSNVNQPKEISLNQESNIKTSKSKEEKIPFALEDNQCVVSYKDGNKTKYFKIDNVIQRETEAYPSAKPQGEIKINKNL
ncbi:hypothetical protein D7030_07155 [Flavobacteriaceae bacterium AU392]|nr:hypothetical protein D1817_01265 [Flavobacteriaceae bacterium]RKM84904.1 hypothetical protein D7030_07155 [Flavobacteriaceae bacterium AU392]